MKKQTLLLIVLALCTVFINLTAQAQQWVQVGQDIDGEGPDDESGYSVSLASDGSRVAISAPGNDGNGIDAGHVRVYDWNGSSWVQVGQDIDGEAAEDFSGYSVSLSSDGPSASWDGTYEGKLLPTADYYFIIDLGDGSDAQTGTITMKY